MADHHRATQVPPVHVRRQEARDGLGQGRELGCADEVEEEEDGEHDDEGEGDEAWIDVDGWQEHGDHGAVEDFSSRVHFRDGGEGEDGYEAEDDGRGAVGGEEEARVCFADDDVPEVRDQG